ncbi:MAG: hypothetical protein JWP85_2113 [Rhodoglobus sp.]|nr:hypothetical protein [Rhodoglobus sp.]
MSPRLDVSHRGVPKLRVAPKVDDLVVPDEFPTGFPRWRVEAVPAAAGMSDIVRLTPDDPACPVKRIQRRIDRVRVVTNPKEKS